MKDGLREKPLIEKNFVVQSFITHIKFCRRLYTQLSQSLLQQSMVLSSQEVGYL